MALDEVVGTQFQPTWLNPKRTQCEIPCPLGCGKTAKLSWIKDELKAAQHGDCPSEKIKAALAKATEAVTATHQNGHANGHHKNGNGNGAVALPEVNLESWKLRLHYLIRADLDDATKINPELVRGMSRETMIDNAMTIMRLGIESQPIYRPPALTKTELEEELYSVAIKTLDAEFGIVQATNHLPITLSWETFGLAVAANEEYLKREPVVDKLLYRRAASMIVGGKHHGKSTLTRWLATCVYKGWDFIGRSVMRGPVFYIASEDEEMAARSELMNLGWRQDDDDLLFLPASKIGDDREGFLDWVIGQAEKIKPSLVIIDMLFDFLNIKDEMSYAETRRAVGTIQRVASLGDTHVVGTHHSPKHSMSDDAAIAALGSQGLAAKVSPIILVRKFGPGVHSISSTSVRDPRGEAVPNSRLMRNDDGTLQLGGSFKTYMLAEVYMERVRELLEAEPGAEMTVGDVVEGLTIPYEVARACLSAMVKLNLVARTGAGKKGKPYRYSIPITEVSAANGGSSGEIPLTPRPPVGQNESAFEPNQGRFGYKED
jgi:hypothetical protein